jgi:hypothetical protein
MGQAFDILQGHIRELVGNNNDLSESRLAICKECPIFIMSSNWGPMCDGTKYINEDGTQWSWARLKGYTKGCGCRLQAKTRIPDKHCIINLW